MGRMQLRMTTIAMVSVLLGATSAVHTLAGEGSGEHEHHHAAAGHAGGHMAQMESNRAALKEKLGATYFEAVRPALDGELARGRELFGTLCASCHGDTGKGNGPAAVGLTPPPADFTDPAHATFYSDRARLEVIRSGSPGATMPAFAPGVSDADTMALLQFIRSLRVGK